MRWSWRGWVSIEEWSLSGIEFLSMTFIRCVHRSASERSSSWIGSSIEPRYKSLSLNSSTTTAKRKRKWRSRKKKKRILPSDSTLDRRGSVNHRLNQFQCSPLSDICSETMLTFWRTEAEFTSDPYAKVLSSFSFQSPSKRMKHIQIRWMQASNSQNSCQNDVSTLQYYDPLAAYPFLNPLMPGEAWVYARSDSDFHRCDAWSRNWHHWREARRSGVSFSDVPKFDWNPVDLE
jgi:hypothetical protein